MEMPRERQIPVPALSQLAYPLALALTAVLVLLVVAGTRFAPFDALARQQARQAAEAELGSARQAVARDQRLGVDSEELAPLQADLAGVAAHERAAKTTREERAVASEASGIASRADGLGKRYAEDQAEIRQSAAELMAGSKSIEAMRGESQATIASARDWAVVATWLNENGVGPPYHGLERSAQGLIAADRGQVAHAAAGVGFYGDRLHRQLLADMPTKAIVISLHGQQLTAYEKGHAVVDTPITSGRLPDLPTDIGPMTVLRKDAPWTMHSPWPKGSPNWYPDAQVQMVVWFTSTGEGMHDASWQSLPYGPGSNTGPDASHGCVHVPLAAEKTLYAWASLGVPVIVYPGDGSPLDAQLQQRTVDANGDPSTGARGA